MTQVTLKSLALASTALFGLMLPPSAIANPNAQPFSNFQPTPHLIQMQKMSDRKAPALRGPLTVQPIRVMQAPSLRDHHARSLPEPDIARSHVLRPHVSRQITQKAPAQILTQTVIRRPHLLPINAHVQGLTLHPVEHYLPPHMKSASVQTVNTQPHLIQTRADHGPIGQTPALRLQPQTPDWSHSEHKASIQTPPIHSEGDILRKTRTSQGFRISIDGRTVTGDGFNHSAHQRITDKKLSEVDIQIKYDGLDVTPILNVGLRDDAVSVTKGDMINFRVYSNYHGFINRAEIRVFDETQSYNDRPILTVPVDGLGNAELRASADLPERLVYLVRVYDSEGRFDETNPRSVSLTDQRLPDPQSDPTRSNTLAGYGVDNTLRRNINVKGGAVTVYGRNVPNNHAPFVFDRAVPLDADRNFVTQEILNFGDRVIPVSVLNPNGEGIRFKRNIHIKDTEFFYVALGDITLGQRKTVGPADLTAASDEDFDDVVVNGRGAFYLKGKVKGDYLIKAALDTGEDRLSRLFKNLDDKDPRQLLRRLDADRFYPVYGDDSYTEEGAPTQGRVFVRVDKDDSHIMWGNFATQITGTEFAHLDRGLYGAIADYKSDATNEPGERKTEATLFAADPGTIPGRDVFRGTGGSLYFLQRQDISIGSERLRIEITDKVTGRVIRTENLRPQEDYDIDYIQGRIILSEPLQSTVDDGQIVRDGGLSGHEARLVARYEYTPGLSDVDGYTIGGRATHWLAKKLRFGVTAQTETTDTADQTLIGVDALYRHSDNTYLKGEFAQSDGPGFGQSNSTDGGFIFDALDAPGVAGQTANAYRVEGAVDLADITPALKRHNIRLRGAYGHKDAGFSGTGQIDDGDVDIITAGLEAKLTQNTHISVDFDDVKSSRRGDTLAVYADIDHRFNEHLSAAIGVRYDERDDSNVTAGTLSPNRIDVNGSRTDVSGEVRYDSGKDWSVRAFGQGTVDIDGTRQGNTRGGIGGDLALNARMTLSGEVSGGEGGMGANAQLNYQRSENSEFYLGYALSTNRSDTGFATLSESRSNQGTLTAGTRTRFNDALSVYGEEQFAHSARGRELTHTYGVDYSPNQAWTFGASIENGTIFDEIDGDFERTAFSLSAGRSSQGLRIATNLEGRFEDGELQGRNRDRTTWLMRNTIAYDVSENWEMLGRFNFALSESDQDSFLNSDFVEGVLAAAYRPIDNDRVNALFKYTYFEDLAPAQQVNFSGRNNLARQKSQILSADAIVDVNRRLSLGGKIGYRSGEVALDRGTDTFIKSNAVLGVVRADLHIVNKWDALIEGRALTSDLADNTQYGALVGVYRHVGNNFKVGVGYSFSKFSDDLTDFDNNSDGAFLNLVGKF